MLMRGFLKELKSLINLRSLKYGSNSIILIVVVVAIAVVVNMIFGMIPLKWDLTANKLYSITDETKKIINNLDTDIVIYGLIDEGLIQNNAQLKQVDELLQHYKNNHIKIEYVDADRNPTIINDIDPDNTLSLKKTDFVVKSAKKMKKIEFTQLFTTTYTNYFEPTVTGFDAEQQFTSAINYVISEYTPVIYFVEGHDEKRFESDFTQLKDMLVKGNYDVKYLDLNTVDKLPEDAEVVVFAGPQKDLTQPEREKLKEFLEEGMDVIFMFDSLNTDVKFPMFESILSNYNITLNYDRIMEGEASRYVPGNPYVIVPYLQQAGLNTNFGSTIGSLRMYVSGARSLNILKNEKNYLTVTSLAKTSNKAVGKLIAGGEDITGPLDLIVSAEYTGGIKPTRILVFGSSSLISDSVVSGYSPNGLYYFAVAMGWMLDDQEQTYIPAKKYETRTIDLTQLQANVLAGITVAGIPLLVLITGGIVWYRRRHL